MSGVVYKYEIPDPTHPAAPSEFGPSGRLIPFVPPPATQDEVIGRTIDEICPSAGTYGMGGPGFFALRLGADWLVIAIWGASDWMTAQGRAVGDTFHDKYGRPKPWLADGSDELSARIVGRAISAFEVGPRSFRITFDDGFDLTIEETPDRRPLLEGSKEPRRFADADDLRRAVFLAPTIEIWV